MVLIRPFLDGEIFRGKDVLLACLNGLVSFQHGDAAFVGFDDITVEVLMLLHGCGFNEVLDVRSVRRAVKGGCEAPRREAFGFAGIGLADEGVRRGFGFVPITSLLPELVLDRVGGLNDERGFAL